MPIHYQRHSPYIVKPDHYISAPTFVSHSFGDFLDVATVTIEWSEADDNLGHSLSYDLKYSTDGATWVSIASDLTSTSTSWDTSSLLEGDIILLISAKDSSGLVNSEVIQLELKDHVIDIPTIIDPVPDANISGVIEVSWGEALDSRDHEVTYSVSYSTDGGTSFTVLATGLTEKTYNWNSSKVSDGTYLLRVTATDGDISSSDSLEVTVDNVVDHTLSVPTVQQPNGGESISGVYTIEWLAAVDSHNHAVNYTVQYSEDGGTTWNNIVVGHVQTSYDWNTSGLSEDVSYLIKVIAYGGEGLSTSDISDNAFIIVDEGSSTSEDTSTSDTSTNSTSEETDDTTGDDFQSVNPLPILNISLVTASLITIVSTYRLRKSSRNV